MERNTEVSWSGLCDIFEDQKVFSSKGHGSCIGSVFKAYVKMIASSYLLYTFFGSFMWPSRTRNFLATKQIIFNSYRIFLDVKFGLTDIFSVFVDFSIVARALNRFSIDKSEKTEEEGSVEVWKREVWRKWFSINSTWRSRWRGNMRRQLTNLFLCPHLELKGYSGKCILRHSFGRVVGR